MPRKGYVAKRDILPDPVYNSKVVTKLINNVMEDGKKTKEKKIAAFEEAMENIMPVLEVKARRVGGATYQVPMEIRPERRQALGLRWLVRYSRERNEKTMKETLPKSVQDLILSLREKLKDEPEIVDMFERCYSNTLDTTVKKMEDGKQ